MAVPSPCHASREHLLQAGFFCWESWNFLLNLGMTSATVFLWLATETISSEQRWIQLLRSKLQGFCVCIIHQHSLNRTVGRCRGTPKELLCPVEKMGPRLGTWLSLQVSCFLWSSPAAETARGKGRLGAGQRCSRSWNSRTHLATQDPTGGKPGTE